MRSLGPLGAVAFLFLLVFLAFAAGCRDDDSGLAAPVRGGTGPHGGPALTDEQIFLSEIDRTRGTKDCFDVIRDPEFVPATGAHGVSGGELVLGVDLGATQVCYPVLLLNDHEIVEHRVDGVPLLACFCPLCRTGAVHVRRIDEAKDPGAPPKEVSFGHSGWLWHNSFLLYDKETNSLWHHLTGECMGGPLRGRTLRRLPAIVLPFADWKAEHPGTLVLPRPARADGSATDPYAKRTAPLSLGYGIDMPTAALFVPLVSLARGSVEDEVGGIPVVVVPAAPQCAVAFSRRVEGRVLSFDGDIRDGRPVLRERDGVRRWWARSGLPLEEGGATERLQPVMGSVWEQDAWRLQHPKGRIRSLNAR